MVDIILSCPHAQCSISKEDYDEHWCDWIAEAALNSLSIELDEMDIKHEKIVGKDFRKEYDLNRKPSRNRPFRESLRNIMTKDAIHLDVHSYPNTDKMDDWYQYDIVLFEHNSPDLVANIRDNLNESGYNVKVIPGDKLNDICCEMEDIGAETCLIEFNSTLYDNGRLDDACYAVAKCISRRRNYRVKTVKTQGIDYKRAFDLLLLNRRYRGNMISLMENDGRIEEKNELNDSDIDLLLKVIESPETFFVDKNLSGFETQFEANFGYAAYPITGYNFEGVDFSQSNLQNVRFEKCSFRKIKAEKSKWMRCRFNACNFYEANMKKIDIQSTVFTDGCSLRNTDFSLGFLFETRFLKTPDGSAGPLNNVRGAIFDYAYIRGADFRGIGNLRYPLPSFNNALYNTQTKWPEDYPFYGKPPKEAVKKWTNKVMEEKQEHDLTRNYRVKARSVEDKTDLDTWVNMIYNNMKQPIIDKNGVSRQRFKSLNLERGDNGFRMNVIDKATIKDVEITTNYGSRIFPMITGRYTIGPDYYDLLVVLFYGYKQEIELSDIGIGNYMTALVEQDDDEIPNMGIFVALTGKAKFAKANATILEKIMRDILKVDISAPKGEIYMLSDLNSLRGAALLQRPKKRIEGYYSEDAKKWKWKIDKRTTLGGAFWQGTYRDLLSYKKNPEEFETIEGGDIMLANREMVKTVLELSNKVKEDNLVYVESPETTGRMKTKGMINYGHFVKWVNPADMMGWDVCIIGDELAEGFYEVDADSSKWIVMSNNETGNDKIILPLANESWSKQDAMNKAKEFQMGYTKQGGKTLTPKTLIQW